MNPIRTHHRLRVLLLAAAVGCLVQTAGAVIVPLTEATNPAGIFSYSSNVETGTTASTRTAPLVSGAYSFTHWTLNGVRKSDAAGRSLNPASFTILEPTNAVANYLPTAQDSDLDGLPDWYEIQIFGSLDQTPASDSDGDGIPLSTELLRGLNPAVADSLVEGGISRRRGIRVLVVAPNEFTLTEASDPVGIINASRTVMDGENVTLSIAPDPSGDRRFTGWFIGSLRVDSPLALQPVTLTVTGNATVVARYVGQSLDSDTDGIPDWFELFHFGNLTQDGDSDSDGDSVSLAQELARSQSPLLVDEIAPGGVSRRRGPLLTVVPVTFVSCTLASDPPGLVSEVITAVAGSEFVTQNLWGTDIAGQRFVGWEIGGVRQVDLSGASSGSARFVAAEGIVATARFVSPTQDSDADGVADWYELAYLGNLGSPGTADSDGDGLDLDREEQGGLSPHQVDLLTEGGISRRRSVGMIGVNLQPFERLKHVLVDGVLTAWFTENPSVSPPAGMDFGTAASPVLCDWDGDGDLDLFVASEGTAAVFENTGSRFRMDLTDRTHKFGGLTTLCAGITRPRLASGDWNLDGRDDLVLADDQGQLHLIPSSHVFTAMGNGAASGVFSPASGGIFPALGDLNGDGRVDLLLAAPGGTVECFLHGANPAAPYDSPSAGFMAGTEITGVSSLSIADFTLDGRNDILAADQDGRIWEFRSQSDGTYFLSSKVWGGSGSGFAPAPAIAAGDLEGDGDIDLMGACPDGALFALRDPKVGRPTGLTASAGANSVLLAWDPDWQSRIKGYHVYRATDAGSAKEKINQNAIVVPRYLDQNLQLAPVHFYHVTALTQAIYAGNSVPTLLESLPSATVSASVRQVSLDLQDTAGFPGSMVRVLLSISNSVGIAGQGMDLRIQYPPGLIPVSQSLPAIPGQTTVRASGLGDDLTFTTNEATANGELRIQGTGGSLNAGQGRLFTLTFRIANSATVGTNLALSLTSAVINGLDGSTIPVTPSGAVVKVNARGNVEVPPAGGVEVGPYAMGDITGDGWVNQVDIDFLKELLRPSAPEPTPEQLSSGDTNGDGKLNHRDLVGMLRISSGLKP